MKNKLIEQDTPSASSSGIIRTLFPSQKDDRTLASIDVDLAQQVNDFYDYSKVVVKKPWGYEYLIFQNSLVTVWILYLKKGCQTSVHCHRDKKTSILVLSGEAVCSTLTEDIERQPGQGVVLEKGVFHRTKSISADGTLVMEIETPANKRDLIRFQDDYGREKLGYETSDHMSFDLDNYNYISFIDSNVYYNVKKRFGHCSIELAQCTSSSDLKKMFQSLRWDTIAILKGSIVNEDNDVLFEPGDVMSPEDISSDLNYLITEPIQVIIVKKIDTMIRLADFVIAHLRERGIKDIFFVPETSNAHLIDAIGRNTQVRSLAFKTESAATLAAEAYAKLTGQPCVVIISSGASGINALTGVANAWVDSTPFFLISGQSRFTELGLPGEEGVRQLANKELDIIAMASPVTKYANIVRDPTTIKAEIDRALSEMFNGRRGPAWIDIPIDILGTNIDETLLSFGESRSGEARIKSEDGRFKEDLQKVLDLLSQSRRPVLIAGFGIRADEAQNNLLKLAEQWKVPVLTSRRGIDLVPDDFPFYFGRPGTYGQRAANFIIQNADLVIAMGARLSLPLIGRNYKSFARKAKKIVIDIDAKELSKKTISADLAIHAQAGTFLKLMLEVASFQDSSPWKEWLHRCQEWKKGFPVDRDFKHLPATGVNPYLLIQTLSEFLREEDRIIVDGGPSLDYVMQAFKVKSGQRIISSPGLEYHGFSLPGAIGVYVGSLLALKGSNKERIICLCEKKGLEQNIAELQTIMTHRLPIKLFVFDGHTNASVQQIQSAYFGGRYVGVGNHKNQPCFDLGKLVEAYGIATKTITNNNDIKNSLPDILKEDGPSLCQIYLSEGCEIIPRMVLTVKPDGKWVSKPIEDMYPFLDREEFRRNMVIEPLDEE